MPILQWVGKDKVVNHHYDVPFRLLKKQYSFQAKQDTPKNSTNNRIIHGDNLEALKSLLPEFEGKINCIYIDPPYNTGNEGWVYNDNVNDPKIKKWLGQVVGKEGEDLSRHDKWLCMMYPRLKLLHRLLADEGGIFISIDANEQASLKLLLDEIFGGGNFVSNIACINNPKGRSDDKYFATAHENIIVYRKTALFNITGFSPEEKVTKRYNKLDKSGKKFREIDLRKTGNEDLRQDRPEMFYPFYYNLNTKELIVESSEITKNQDFIPILPMKSNNVEGRWRWGKKTALENIGLLYAKFMPTKKQWGVFEKDYLEEKNFVTPTTVWDFKDVNSERGTEVFIKYLGFEKSSFPNPKPVGTIERIIKISTRPNSIVLDSFAGSGTTAHAVLKLNAEDGGNRQFICIEMMDYAETITAERVRRVIEGYGEDNKAVAGLGGGFDFYTVDEPLFLKGNKDLNEEVGVEAIRDYVAYTENLPPEHRHSMDNAISSYSLGIKDTALYLFYYEKERITTLDMAFLGSLHMKQLPTKPENYIIYADKCALDKDFMLKHGITFKRIPRDISRF